VTVSFYHSSKAEKEVSWLPNGHYSGVYGLLKLTLPTLLPKNLDKVIVLDTDVAAAADIGLLWRKFENFESTRASLGLVENQSDW